VAAKEEPDVVVICPKCKTRLKVDESKLSEGGSRFKCPKCSAVLVVKKPAVQEKKTLDIKKILVAHSNPETLKKIVSLLTDRGYRVVTAVDGIDVMVKGLKEYPFLAIIEVALPKIYGFEVCKRLKMRAETKEMKFILVPSIYDRSKYRREPVSLYGADEYIEDHDISTQLVEKIERLSGLRAEEKTEKPYQPEVSPVGVNRPEAGAETAAKAPASPSASGAGGERIERAKRLARTIINDIYLYNTAKLDASVRNDNFYAVFAPELKEGKKLYDQRILPEVRVIGDFYKEAIENFISARKKALS
jgi:predicted Zn finger-like uncharacterized protein